jgi:hypothetical protein
MQTKREYVCKTKKDYECKTKKSIYSKLHVKNIYDKQTKICTTNKKSIKNTNVTFMLPFKIQKLCIPRIKRCCEKYPVLSVIYLITFGAILSPILNMLGMKKMQLMSFSKEL